MAHLTIPIKYDVIYQMAKNKHKNSLYSTFAFRLLLLTTIVSLSLLGVKNLIENYQYTNVLGETSYLDNRGSGSSDSSNASNDDSLDVVESPKPTEEPDRVEPTEAPEQEYISSFSFENLRELRVRTEENKIKIKLDSRGGSFELKNEDGKLKIKIKQENGNEIEIENESLDDINEILKEEGIHIAIASGNGFIIRRGEFEAGTRFPLSINPTTNQLTVTTPAGVKNVAVLPDQAVLNLLRLKFIDKVASDSTTGTSQNISLGLLNDEPTFQVKGLDDQKFLGFLPVSIQKVSFVSAQSGEVLKIDTTFLNRLLDLFSVQ